MYSIFNFNGGLSSGILTKKRQVNDARKAVIGNIVIYRTQKWYETEIEGMHFFLFRSIGHNSLIIQIQPG